MVRQKWAALERLARVLDLAVLPEQILRGWWYFDSFTEVPETLAVTILSSRLSPFGSGMFLSPTQPRHLNWARTVSQSTAIWIFVVFNSVIHTLMYFYYAMTTIGIQPPPVQYLITSTQFIVGGSLATSYLLIPYCLKLIPGYEAYELLSDIWFR